MTLDEIEGALRDAAGSAYVIGTADRFEVVIGCRRGWPRSPRLA